MIKFFRRIRQSLLSENKFSKYSLYALGEIILVVIGILIALQINNWNTETSNSKKEKKYLTNLKADLNNQILEIEEQILREKLIASEAKIILDYYNKNNTIVMDSTLAVAGYALADRRTFKTTNPTYTELINTGDMKLISNESFRRNLVTYQQEIVRIKEVIKLNNSSLVDDELAPKIREIIPIFWAKPNDYSELTKNNLVYEGGVSSKNLKALIDISNQNFKNSNILLQFINLASSRYDNAWFHVQIMLTKKAETQTLLDELNSLLE